MLFISPGVIEDLRSLPYANFGYGLNAEVPSLKLLCANVTWHRVLLENMANEKVVITHYNNNIQEDSEQFPLPEGILEEMLDSYVVDEVVFDKIGNFVLNPTILEKWELLDFYSKDYCNKNHWMMVSHFVGARATLKAFYNHLKDLYNINQTRHFWKCMLYRMEHTYFWCEIFDFLYFKNLRNWQAGLYAKYPIFQEMYNYDEFEPFFDFVHSKVDIYFSNSWLLTLKHNILYLEQFDIKDFARFMTLKENFDYTYKFNNLILSGDVETNPGPVFSKLHAQVFGLDEITGEMSKLTHFLSHDFKDQILQVIETCSMLTDAKIKGVDVMINDAKKEINELAIKRLEDFNNIKNKFFQFAALLTLCTFMFNMGWKKLAITGVVVTILFSYNVPNKLIKLFQEEREQQELIAQNDGDDSNVLVRMLGSLSSFFLLDKIPSSNKLNSLCKQLDTWSKGIRGTKTIFTELHHLWKKLEAWLQSLIYEIPEDLKSMESQIAEWADRIEHFSDLIIKKKTLLNIEQTIEMGNLYKKGLSFRSWAQANKSPRDLVQFINNNTISAQQLHTYVEKNNTIDGGVRVKPLCISLFGESQIGKSTMVMPLAHDIMMKAGMTDPKLIRQQIYARQAETEFWDGYQGQFCIIYDDAMATKDEAAKPNVELSEMIRVMNVFPHHLHMASLEDKNTYNTSELVILTINDINAKINSLSYEDAFYNRIFEHCYEVRPTKQFEKVIDMGGNNVKIVLDKEKLLKYKAEKEKKLGKPISILFEIYEFVKHERVIINGKATIKSTGVVLNYEEFSKIMQEAWYQNRELYRGRNNFLDERIKSKIASLEAQSWDYDFEEIGPDESIEDYISRNLKYENGFDNLLTIENALLDSARAADYEAFNSRVAAMPPPRNYKYELKRIFEEWQTKIKNKIYEIINTNYPIFKYCTIICGVLAVGGVAYCFFKSMSKQKAFNMSDKLTYEEYQDNLIYLHNHKKEMTREEHDEAFDLTIKSYARYLESENLQSTTDAKDGKKAKSLKSYNAENLQSTIEALDGKGKKSLRSYSAEGVVDNNCLEMGQSILLNSLYLLEINRKGVRKPLGNVLFIKGYNFIMPRHFLRHLIFNKDYDNILTLTRVNSKGKQFKDMIEFPVSDLLKPDYTLNRCVELTQPNGDVMDTVLCCVNNKGKVHIHVDILKHFITTELQQKLVGETKAYLFGYSKMKDTLLSQMKEANKLRASTSPTNISSEHEKILQRDGYDYIASTVKGDCGAPILLRSKQIQRKIIGIHVAGNENENAYGVRLNVEILERHLELLEKKVGFVAQMALEIDVPLISNEDETPDGIFPSFGKTDLALHSPNTTKLVPSLLHNKIFPTITRPARLSPFVLNGVLIDPGNEGLKKCGVNTVLIKPNLINMARQNMFMKICMNTKQLDLDEYCRVLSYKEAIMGTGDEYMTPMNRGTSAGYPFCNEAMKYKKKGKTLWLGKDDEYDFTSPHALELKRIVDQLEEDCKIGKIRGVICADTKKDERRPHAKVDAGKTRMFSACPIHYVILFRKYYLGFSAWIMHNRNKNDISVGTNVYSSEWDFIARKLKTKGEHVIAGDFSNFDGSLNNSVMWAIFDIVNDWYKRKDSSKENEHVRLSLWAHLVNSVHIYGDNIYQWTHSQPSGNPFTVILNSIYNCLIMRIAYLKIMEEIEPKLCNMLSFEENVSMVCYGDDNCLNISDNIIDKYNQQTISKVMLELGHTYTDESKSDANEFSRLLSDIKFLKRSFVKHPDDDLYVAPLAIEVLYDMINWIRKNEIDPNELLRTNIETSLMEMSLHGKEKYNDWVSKLLNLSEIYDLGVHILTYEENRFKIEHCDHLGLALN